MPKEKAKIVITSADYNVSVKFLGRYSRLVQSDFNYTAQFLADWFKRRWISKGGNFSVSVDTSCSAVTIALPDSRFEYISDYKGAARIALELRELLSSPETEFHIKRSFIPNEISDHLLIF